MLSRTASISLSNRSTTTIDDPAVAAIVDIEQQIQLLDVTISDLNKSKKQLKKLEDELSEMNMLIDSGVGTKKDQLALKKKKRQLRDRRIELWDILMPLPTFQNERSNLVHDLDTLRRRHGIITTTNTSIL